MIRRFWQSGFLKLVTPLVKPVVALSLFMAPQVGMANAWASENGVRAPANIHRKESLVTQALRRSPPGSPVTPKKKKTETATKKTTEKRDASLRGSKKKTPATAGAASNSTKAETQVKEAALKNKSASTPAKKSSGGAKVKNAGKKKAEPVIRGDAGAIVATTAMVKALNASNAIAEASDKKKEEEPEDAETAEYVKTHVNLLNSSNPNAEWIFATSVDTIKTVFKNDDPSKTSNIIKTLKQTACVFVAETHYGNLPKGYDHCDQTNIGQIRPPAYKAIYKACPKNFSPKDLNFLGAGTSCKTLHPYEMPLCCNALNAGEAANGCARYRNNPLVCISKEKRNLLENLHEMTRIDESNDNYQDGKPDPIRCLSTSGSVYYRIPAVPKHSIFASIFYLKLVGFDPMSDASFSAFGAKRYNGASAAEQRGYQRKLNTCLKILDRSENSKIIEETFQRIMENRSVSKN